MERNSFLGFHGHGTFFMEFLHIFCPKKFTPMLAYVDTGDLDDPESLCTKRQK